jgi:hypothetical protein
MQTTTLTNKQEKKSKPILNKFLQLLMRKTDADKRIAVYGRDPLKQK